MLLKYAAPGTYVVTYELIGDNRNATEVREVLYIREEGRECRFPNNVPVARVAIIQGDPLSPQGARYFYYHKEPCRDPGEADGRIHVRLVTEAVWYTSFVPLLSPALKHQTLTT